MVEGLVKEPPEMAMPVALSSFNLSVDISPVKVPFWIISLACFATFAFPSSVPSLPYSIRPPMVPVVFTLTVTPSV